MVKALLFLIAVLIVFLSVPIGAVASVPDEIVQDAAIANGETCQTDNDVSTDATISDPAAMQGPDKAESPIVSTSDATEKAIVSGKHAQGLRSFHAGKTLQL